MIVSPRGPGARMARPLGAPRSGPRMPEGVPRSTGWMMDGSDQSGWQGFHGHAAGEPAPLCLKPPAGLARICPLRQISVDRLRDNLWLARARRNRARDQQAGVRDTLRHRLARQRGTV